MKTIILWIVSLILSLVSANAQTTSNSSKSTTKVSISYDGDTEKKSYYRSFAIIDMDNSYRIKVRFMKDMTDEVKSYLIDQLGEENMIFRDETYLWKKEIENEEVYEVTLKNNRLRISVDKELISDKFLKKFKQMGKELKTITSKESKI
ncbi:MULTISPECIES: hypothetical protein [Aquimarina]|uniref:Uncharacterized protein n=1 Tax=Aquimarina algiphila TaxID=2047982 RepID=A0A554VF16_9FLAO|nr:MULTISPECIES: hypothetical protein [Aquimarina]TSE05750.1 hypothetical protein FOF46_21595 [Aquimarina algiphila]